jgi:hypothetical protein
MKRSALVKMFKTIRSYSVYIIQEVEEDLQNKKTGLLPHKFMKIFEYDHTRITKEPSFYTATYRQDKEEQ